MADANIALGPTLEMQNHDHMRTQNNPCKCLNTKHSQTIGKYNANQEIIFIHIYLYILCGCIRMRWFQIFVDHWILSDIYGWVNHWKYRDILSVILPRPWHLIRDHWKIPISNFLFKSNNFQALLLIGWQLWYQPIGSHVKKPLLIIIDFILIGFLSPTQFTVTNM